MTDLLHEASLWEVVFTLIILLVLAIFYTLIIPHFYKIVIKPSWLFFAVLPSVGLLTAFIDSRFVLLVIPVVFLLLIPILIVGLIYRFLKERQKEYSKRRSKKESHKAVVFSMLKYGLLSLIAIGLFFLNPILFVLMVFVYTIFIRLISPSSKDVFIRMQASLPTSKVRSVAMGLVELKGVTQLIEPLISRLKEKECIGYKYTIETVSTNNDGKKSYTEVSSETICNPFILKDETGEITVSGDTIEFEWFPVDTRYTNKGKRHSQYVLFPNQEVLLIGKANAKNNSNFIERESLNNIFTIAPFEEVTRSNRLKPLRNAFYTYLIVLFTFIGIILMTDIIIEDNTIYIHFSKLNIDIKHLFK